jgi:copper chaperone
MPGLVRTFHVPDISCDHCKTAIEGEVGQLTGVTEVVVKVDDRTVIVEGPASDEAVTAAIEEAGYEVAAG